MSSLLRNPRQCSLLDADALALIEGALQVSAMKVRDVMVPRSQMVVVQRDATLEELLPPLTQSAHSRFPVIEESRDEVVGILLAKDLLPCFGGGKPSSLHMHDVLRPAVFIPASKRLNVLLKGFRASRNHIAVAVDEYGGVAGLVTIGAVLEEIAGDIEGEPAFEEDTFIRPLGDGEYSVKALTPIADFSEALGTEFSDAEFDTVDGLIMRRLGRVAKRGEAVTIDDVRFRALHSAGRRIHLRQVTRRDRVSGTASGAESR